MSTITEAKNNGLKINVDGREITVDKVESLVKGVGSEKIDKREFKKKYNDIVNDVEKILNTPHTRSQDKMIKILSQLKGLALYRQPDTTNMPELESEESAEQRRNQQGK